VGEVLFVILFCTNSGLFNSLSVWITSCERSYCSEEALCSSYGPSDYFSSKLLLLCITWICFIRLWFRLSSSHSEFVSLMLGQDSFFNRFMLALKLSSMNTWFCFWELSSQIFGIFLQFLVSPYKEFIVPLLIEFVAEIYESFLSESLCLVKLLLALLFSC
jgi:hypothetical protein